MENVCRCDRDWVHEHWPEPDSILAVHPRETCEGETCTIHNPSDHLMKDFPQHFRLDRGIMERICPHGTGHPDPDDLTNDTVHGCDGCCSPLGYQWGIQDAAR